MEVTSLYICPWSLNDPLTKSQSLAYLFELTKQGYKFALLTFENPRFAIAPAQFQATKLELESKGIYWYSARYRAGLSVSAKILNNLDGLSIGLKIFRRHRPRVIHSRSSITAALGVALSKITGLKLLYDADSVLSEEYADIGHWSRQSNGFKIMAYAENAARRNADQIIVLTEALKKDFQERYKITKKIDVIPCCVNTEKYRFDTDARLRRRNQLKLTDENVFVYVGKIGSRYLIEEIFDFFKSALNEIKSCKLLIVSQDSAESFHNIAYTKDVAPHSYFVVKADPLEVSEYLSASDVGLALIKNSKSEEGSSPIKVAEYLSNGLPVVITDGIGDCSRLIGEEKIGSVIDALSVTDYLKTIKELKLLLSNEERLRTKCQEIAAKHFSLEEIGAVRYLRVYRQMLGE